VSGEGQLARYNLGLAFRSKRYYVEALREYQSALERGEERDLVLQAMAEMHVLMRQPAEALALYDELLGRQSDSPKLWNERGVALHQAGRGDDAEESYRRALIAEPSYAIAHNNLGVSQYQRGALEDAFHVVPHGARRRPAFSKGATQSRAAPQSRKTLSARARGVPPSARHGAGPPGRVERNRPRAF
jgi:Flp pilus assembly protein TadD